MPIVPPDERIKRAMAALEAAQDVLAGIPPAGRARAGIIARARKHLRAVSTILAPMLSKRGHIAAATTNEQKEKAQELLKQAEERWPAADYGKKTPGAS